MSLCVNPLQKECGKFMISLDFELQWGVLDHVSATSLYRDNIKNVWGVVPRLLDTFGKHGVHATFATVGMMFHRDFASLLQQLPLLQPSYTDRSLSPYSRLEEIVKDRPEYYLAADLIGMIRDWPGMEIASHTYSHYYCLEPGQAAGQFRADMEMAVQVAGKAKVELKSVVFPRNQINDDYLKICSESGIEAVRTNEKGWMYKASGKKGNTLFKRIFRLLDVYVNLTGYNCYRTEGLMKSDGVVLIPSSRFLRPYNRKLAPLDFLKMRRIKNCMTHAARNGELFHLWWHPHNFGSNVELNFRMLDEILEHYKRLNKYYGFTSVNMSEMTNLLKSDENNE